MRKRLTWGVVGVVGLIATLASVDALRDGAASRPEPFARAQETTPPTHTEGTPATNTDDGPVAPCAKKQIALWAGTLGGSTVVELYNVSAEPCRTPRLRIRIRFFDERGVNEIAATAGIQEAFAPTILSPDVDLTVGFNVIDRCGGGKPRTYVVEAGQYVTGARVPKGSVYSCLDDLGP